MLSSGLIIHAEPEEDLVLLSVKGGSRDHPGAVPEWLYKAARFDTFVCATRTSAVISIFIGESFLSKVELPSNVEIERKWASLRVNKADTFHAAFQTICTAFEAAKIQVQVVSSPSCEWFLMPAKQLLEAVPALLSAGHVICPARRICGPLPAKLGRHAKCRRLAGAWKLITEESESYSSTTSCFRLQGACGVYIDVRPAESRVEEASCAGFLHMDVGSRHRLVCLQPPSCEVASASLVQSEDEKIQEVVQKLGRSSRESWKRFDPQTVAVVLELIDEPKRSISRQGYWLIAGGRFARVIGLNNGQGLIDGYCCSSLGQLEKMFGAASIADELKNHYEVISGVMEKPGRFRVEYEVPAGESAIFLDTESGIGGKIELPPKLGGEVLHHRPGGIQRWRVLEWGFDPFTPGSPLICEEQLPAEHPHQPPLKEPETKTGPEKGGKKKRKKEPAQAPGVAGTAARSKRGNRKDAEKPKPEHLPKDKADEGLAGRINISIKANEAECQRETGQVVEETSNTKALEEEEREPLPANFKFPQGYPPPAPPGSFPGKFPVGYPPPPDKAVATEEDKAAALAAVASAAVAGALPPGTTQAVVIPSAVPGAAPIVLSTYKTALEGMSPSQIAEALSEQVLPTTSSLPPATALIAAAGAARSMAMVQQSVQPLLVPGQAFLQPTGMPNVAPVVSMAPVAAPLPSLPAFSWASLPLPCQASPLTSSLPLPPPPPQPSQHGYISEDVCNISIHYLGTMIGGGQDACEVPGVRGLKDSDVEGA